MACLETDVDEFGAQRGDLVVGLDDVGSQRVDLVAERIDRGLAFGQVRSQPHGDLLGSVTTLLLAPQRRAEVGVCGLGGTLDHQLLGLRLPARRSLQPQDADRVDQLGQRTCSDRRAEHVVGLDRSAETAEGAGGNSGLAGSRTDLSGNGDRGPALGDLVAHRHGVLDRTAQLAVLDRGRVGHVDTILHGPVRPNGRS